MTAIHLLSRCTSVGSSATPSTTVSLRRGINAQEQASFLLCTLVVVLSCFVGQAATATWKNGDGYWTDLSAWVEGFEPTEFDDVLFDNVRDGSGGRVQLHQTQADLKIRSVRSMTFLSGVGSYLIDNQTGAVKKDLVIGAGGIVNDSTAVQTFDTKILLSAPQTWSANSGGIIADDILQLGDNTLTLDGASDITINGAVSGTGGIIKEGSGTLALTAPSLYTGATVLNAGTITYTVPQTFAGSFVLNGGVLDANNQSLTFSSLTVGGDATLRLGSDATSQMVQFTDSTWLAGVLAIENWNPAASSDQLYFANEPSPVFLSQIQFSGYAPGALWNEGVVVPVPEPSRVLLAAVGLLALLAFGRLRNQG